MALICVYSKPTGGEMEKKRLRLLTFASLYVVQGVGLAYFRNFQKPYLD
jgi:hypothetical protein